VRKAPSQLDYEAALQAPVLLESLGIDGEYLNTHVLGHGAYATAWRLPDGRVLKVTSDAQDALASAKLARIAQLPAPGLPRIYAVHKLRRSGPGDQRYAVVMEFLRKTRKTRRTMAIVEAIDESDGAEQVVARPNRVRELADAMYVGLTDTELDIVTVAITSVLKGVVWLRKNGFAARDLHEHNGGLTSDGRLVLLDMGVGPYDWRRAGDATKIPLTRNPLLAKPPGAFHRLQNTSYFRHVVGRGPRQSDYDGVHTTSEPVIAAAYAMSAWRQMEPRRDDANKSAYPVIVTLDVTGLEPLPDVDAMLKAGEAADVPRAEYRKLVAEGKTFDDLLEEEGYVEPDEEATVGADPAAFVFEDTGHRVLGSIAEAAESDAEREALFEAFLRTGKLSSRVMALMVKQQRYMNDFDLDRVVRIEAVRPWWHRVEAEWDDAEVQRATDLGYYVWTLGDWPFNDPGDVEVLYARRGPAGDAVEYHGTTSAVIAQAFPGLIPVETPFPVEEP